MLPELAEIELISKYKDIQKIDNIFKNYYIEKPS